MPGQLALVGGDEFRAGCEEMDREIMRASGHDPAKVVIVPTAAVTGPAKAANDGATTAALRRRLAAIAYARTADYDAAIGRWFAGELGEALPRRAAIIRSWRPVNRMPSAKAPSSRARVCAVATWGVAPSFRYFVSR